MAITTLSEYKSYAGITVTTWDTPLTTLIGVAQSMAERLCGRSFDAATFTKKFDGKGQNVIVLPNVPITSITSVVLTDSEGTTITTYSATDYKIDLDTGELRLTPESFGPFARDPWGDVVSGPGWGVSPDFPDQFRNITVVYVGGYTTAPDALKGAVWRAVDVLFAARRRDSTVASESIGSYSVSFAGADREGGNAVNEQVAAIFADWDRCGL